MCDPGTLMTAAASAASTAIGITQQVQRAQGHQADYSWLASQQRTAAAADEPRRRTRDAGSRRLAPAGKAETSIEVTAIFTRTYLTHFSCGPSICAKHARLA